MWCKNVKLTLMATFVVGLVILFVAMGFCGADFGKCRSHSDHASPPPPSMLAEDDPLPTAVANASAAAGAGAS